MIARTNEFKQEIAKLGKEIDFKIVLYENDKIITEGSDFLMTEDNLNLIVEQINSAEIRETITSQDIYNVSVVRKGNLLSTMMKEIDFEIKQDLKLGEIVDCSFGLKVGNNYEYINYGKFIVYSKEYNEDTSTYSYVAFDSMMLSMIEVDDTSIIQGVTIKKAIENICEKVGLEVNITAEDITNLPNLNKTINESAFNNIEMTYRDVLDMICQALGVSMVVNDRELYLKTPSEVIDSEIKNVEGTSIAINDAINKELDEIKLYGDTQQQTYSGKNLLNKVDYTTISTGNNDGASNVKTSNKITITTGSGANSGIYISKSVLPSYITNYDSSKTYYVSMDVKANRSIIFRTGCDTFNDFTINTNIQRIVVQTKIVNSGLIMYSRSTTANDTIEITNIMFSTSSDTTYEQYVGGTPSPNPDFPQEVQTVSGEQVIYDIGGKNLFDKNDVVNGALNGDNTLIPDNYYCTSNYIPVIPNTTYYKTATGSARFKYYDINKNRLSNVYNDIPNAGNAQAFTTPQNAYYIRLSINQTNGTSVYVDTLQIEKGNQATTYEEYKGQEFKINLRGINIFDKSTITNNYRIGSNGDLYSDSNYFLTDYIEVKPNVAYTGNTVFTLYYNRIAFYDKNKNRIGLNDGLNLYSFTPPANTKYVRFAKDKAQLDTFMLVEGTEVPETYISYREPIELCKIGEYQDFIDGTVDNWYINKYVGKVVLDGSNDETWTFNTSKNRAAIPLTNGKIFGDIKSNMFKEASGYNDTTINTIYLYANEYSWMYLDSTQFPDLATWKTYISTHNLEVYYVLATPTREKITDTELNSQLNALAQAQLYNGYNNINVSGNLPIYLKIKYYTKYELESFNEEYLKDRNVTFGEKYMINSIVLSRSEDNDTIYRRDEESIELNGLHEFKIKDNLIMLYDDREDYIDEIYNQLNGLEFYINDFTSPGITYLEPLDFYNVNIGDKTYKCLLLNDEIKIQQGLEETIYTEMPKETTTDYTIASKTDKEVSFIVDKQNGKINAKVSEDNIIASLNLAVENGQGIVELKGNTVTIDSDYFKLNAEGDIQATGGTLGGWNINSEGLRNNDNFFIKNNGLSNVYTFNDILMLRLILQGVITVTPGTAEFQHYDINNDGVLDTVDLLLLRKMLLEIE